MRNEKCRRIVSGRSAASPPGGERRPRKADGDGGDLLEVAPVEITGDVLLTKLRELPGGGEGGDGSFGLRS